jgi:hypothetical protein
MLLVIRILRWIFSRLLLVSSGAGRLCSSGCRSRREESISQPGTKLVVLFVWGIKWYPWNTYMFPGFTETPKLSPELCLFGRHSVWNCNKVIRRYVVKGVSSSWMDERMGECVHKQVYWVGYIGVSQWVSQCLGMWGEVSDIHMYLFTATGLPHGGSGR